MTLVIYKTAERPGVSLWIRDSAGALVDFSTGYTFTFKLGSPGSAADFSTTSVTGAAGAGSEPDGTPNAVVTFTAGELDNLTLGPTSWQLTATTGGLGRVWEGTCTVKAVIT